MVLFFGLVFSVKPPLEIFLPTPLIEGAIKWYKSLLFRLVSLNILQIFSPCLLWEYDLQSRSSL